MNNRVLHLLECSLERDLNNRKLHFGRVFFT